MKNRTCEIYQDAMLDLLDGTAEASMAADVARHEEVCEDCRETYQWVRTSSVDLTALGDSIRRDTPGVDLVDSVMRAVARTKATPPQVIRFEPRLARSRIGASAWFAGLATAAAAVVLVVWLSGYRLTNVSDPSMPALQARGGVQKTPVLLAAKDRLRPSKTRLEDVQRLLPGGAKRSAEKAGLEALKRPELKGVTAEDILSLRRGASSDPGALAQLNQLASLAEDLARELVAADGTPTDAKIGASRALPATEAERVLLAALKESSDNPYLHSELAKLYSKDPSTLSKADAELEKLSASDPGNALTQYRLAANKLSQGDMEGASVALERAQELSDADTYSREAAKYQEEALKASGMEPTTARVTAALTAGTQEYADLTALGAQFVDSGRAYEEKDELDSAQFAYASAQNLGGNVAQTSQFATERLAGLDIQSEALSSLAALVGAQNVPQAVEVVSTQTQGLINAYNGIIELFESMDTFFSGNIPQNLLLMIADFLLQQGDSSLLSQFTGTGQR